MPDHAAVDLAVRLAQADPRAAGFAGLINAVLRRLAREGATRLASIDTADLDTPEWLMTRWTAAYGAVTARAIAAANRNEPALDLTVKSDPEAWAKKLGGRVLATQSVRVNASGAVSTLPGFAEGAWWVQDAAASLPARLLGDVHGRRVADLCAAPGGKTAQLALAGASVTAVDRAPARLKRLRDNLARLGLSAEIVGADVEQWTAGPFDAVLLDAPCSSTGTIRRHPDVPWLKTADDVAKLSALQRRLLDRAVALTKPGGTLVYCTCSLEPQENEMIVAELLMRETRLQRVPINATEIFGCQEFVAVPMIVKGAVVGVILADNLYSGRAITDSRKPRNSMQRWPASCILIRQSLQTILQITQRWKLFWTYLENMHQFRVPLPCARDEHTGARSHREAAN